MSGLNGPDIAAVYQLLTEVAGRVAGHDGKLDGIAAHLAEHERRLEGIAAHLAEHDRKLDDLAAGLASLREAALRLMRSELYRRPVIGSWDKLIDYCTAHIAHGQVEGFHILFLDRKNALIKHEQQQRGTIDHTPVYPREVVKRALELQASALILVHNHPSGDPTPSKADIAVTRDIVRAAQPRRDRPRPPDHRPRQAHQPARPRAFVTSESRPSAACGLELQMALDAADAFVDSLIRMP